MHNPHLNVDENIRMPSALLDLKDYPAFKYVTQLIDERREKAVLRMVDSLKKDEQYQALRASVEVELIDSLKMFIANLKPSLETYQALEKRKKKN